MPSHESADKADPPESTRVSATMVTIFRMFEKMAKEAAARACCVKDAAKLMAMEKATEESARTRLKPLIECKETTTTRERLALDRE